MVVAFYNFSETVRTALIRAREEASRLGHRYVGTEHLLLGVLPIARDVTARLLDPLDPARLRVEAERLAGPCGTSLDRAVDTPYTGRAKRVLELAMREAMELGDEAVSTEHLLLGILREEQGIGARVLMAAGLRLEAARAVVMEGRGAARAPRQRSLTHRILVWLHDRAGWPPRP